MIFLPIGNFTIKKIFVQAGKFLKNNKRAVSNKDVQAGKIQKN